jgi:small GTP-binding protein
MHAFSSHPQITTFMSKTLKIVVVGDGAVGKTCLLVVHNNGKFPTEYVPTVCENYRKKILVNDVEHSVQLWDTAGQEEMVNVRQLSYSHTDVFIVCFSLADRVSFENIADKWVPELKRNCKVLRMLLVGTKSDLRDGAGSDGVSTAEGQTLAKQIGAFDFIECSAIKALGVKQVFDRAIGFGIHPPREGCCSVQ